MTPHTFPLPEWQAVLVTVLAWLAGQVLLGLLLPAPLWGVGTRVLLPLLMGALAASLARSRRGWRLGALAGLLYAALALALGLVLLRIGRSPSGNTAQSIVSLLVAVALATLGGALARVWLRAPDPGK